MPAPTYRVDERLKEYATEAQARAIDAVNEGGSLRAAAEALGQNKSTVRDAIESVKRKAARMNFSPEHHMTRPIAPGLKMRGTSNLYKRGEPEPLLEWVKTSADEEAREAI